MALKLTGRNKIKTREQMINEGMNPKFFEDQEYWT